MTEETWLSCTEPWLMLDFLRDRASNRKFRLFAVACCRRMWGWFKYEQSRRAVDVAEQYADGNCSAEHLAAACRDAESVSNPQAEVPEWAAVQASWPDFEEPQPSDPYPGPARTFPELARECAWTAEIFFALQGNVPSDALPFRLVTHQTRNVEKRWQVRLIHEIFNNPFRPVTVDPSWLSPAVTALAQAIYIERRFTDLPMLADALEKYGCTCNLLLQHCRDGEDHVRGCWAVDLVRGED